MIKAKEINVLILQIKIRADAYCPQMSCSYIGPKQIPY